MPHQYDIILTGAGGAGLSLAYHLSQGAWRDKTILLLDSTQKQQNDRTWCYWSTQAPYFPQAQTHAWPKLEFFGPKGAFRQADLGPYQYYCLRGDAFYRIVWERLAQFPNIHFRAETVKKIEAADKSARVFTDTAVYEGRWVFNSIPALAGPLVLPPDAMKQHFLGFFIKTKQPAFDPLTARLMDFRVAQENEVRFFYLLPFSETEALVEFTVFSPQLHPKDFYRQYLYQYLQTHQPTPDYEIEEEEWGTIPMHPPGRAATDQKTVVHIGTAGGMTKPTTGYTFRNLQEYCAQLMQKWDDFEVLPKEAHYFNPARFYFYDQLLLHIIRHRPAQVADIMQSLFMGQSFASVLRFLDEKSTLRQEAQMFWQLPWSPFLNALYETHLRPSFRRLAFPLLRSRPYLGRAASSGPGAL
ncbi:MAG: lycopene cyclase family protein [Microscillaceae bacterium]